jgi:predicted metalloprotease
MHFRSSVAAALVLAASLLQMAPVAHAAPAPAYPGFKHINTADGGLDALLFNNLRPSLDKYWGQQLGKAYTAPGWSWINRAGGTATACGTISLEDAGNEAAFYCPNDKVIYFNADFLLSQETGYGFAGVVEVIAHEYGHHIQHLKGLSPNMSVSASELQADRDAGAYLSWAKWGYIDNGKRADWYNLTDLQAVAYGTGDYAYNDPDHHGTPTERSDAITRGWNIGPGMNATAI